MKKLGYFLVLIILTTNFSSCQLLIFKAIVDEYKNMQNELAYKSTKPSDSFDDLTFDSPNHNFDLTQVIDRFPLTNINANLEEIKIIIIQKMSPEDADAAAIQSINEALLGMEKEAQLLDIGFSMSNTPIKNGIYLMSIELEESNNLTLEIFDKEGFMMLSQTIIEVLEGNNYKKIDLTALEKGQYLFRLKDNEGRELVRLFDY